MPILKMVKNVTVANSELVFTRYLHNLNTIENTTVISSVQSLQEFDAKEMYLHLNNHMSKVPRL